MDLNLENLDADIRSFFEQAYATFRERTTCDEAVRNREPFVGPGRNSTPRPMPKMTAERAFEQLIVCKARVARNDKPASAQHIEEIWDEFYALKYRHVPKKYPFPAADLAALKLSILVFHDVFNDVKIYKNQERSRRAKPSPMYPGRPKSIGEIMTDLTAEPDEPLGHAPYNLVVQTAETFAKKIKKDRRDLDEAINFLEREGYKVRHCDHAELREMQSLEANARLYPRTYL